MTAHRDSHTPREHHPAVDAAGAIVVVGLALAFVVVTLALALRFWGWVL